MGGAARRDGRGWSGGSWLVLAVVVGILALVGAHDGGNPAALTADRAIALPETLDEAVLVRHPPPRGARPPRIALLLHGSGSSPQRFLDFADEVARHGFVALVVRGPRELGVARYTWSSDDETHALLARVLELAERELSVARERPILVGYSLGATLAVHLLAQHPDVYASAFAISPGPLGADRLPAASVPRPLVVLVGSEDAPSEKAVAGIERAWAEADEPFWVVHHDGGHRPPSDWRDRIDDAMTWVAVKAGS